MGIGASVFLLALGAVLAFAVHATVSGIDINVIGWVLMVAGVIGLAMTAAIFGRRDRIGTTAAAPLVRDTYPRETVVTTERVL
jgi:hypothetical protein